MTGLVVSRELYLAGGGQHGVGLVRRVVGFAADNHATF